jgi:TIGR03009 family protein
MLRIFSWVTMIALVIMPISLWAQTPTSTSEAWPRSDPARTTPAASQPDQPVNPQLPTLQRRAVQNPAGQYSPQTPSGNQAQAFPSNQVQSQQTQQNPSAQPSQPPPPPFTLTPQEEAQLDRALTVWEQKSQDVKNFSCSFVRWEYDPVFAKPNSDPNAPVNTDQGILKYASPDKGVYRIVNKITAENKLEPVEQERADHWICDGKSVFQYIPKQKQLVEHKLPPQLQGKAIVDGPLPFLFGTDAQKLRQRYFLRLITPSDAQNQLWLEAYPRFQEDAANFRRAILILTMSNMNPKALQIYQPNGKSRTSYEFYDIKINDPLWLLQGNPFQAFTPRGWQKIIEEAPATQAGRPAGQVR